MKTSSLFHEVPGIHLQSQKELTVILWSLSDNRKDQLETEQRHLWVGSHWYFMARWLHQGQCGSSSFKTFVILKPRIQRSLERTWARRVSIPCKPLLCLAGGGLLLFQAPLLSLLQVLVEMIMIGLDTGMFELRVAFIRFHLHLSLSRQRYDYREKNDHEAEVPSEFTQRISKAFWTSAMLCARHWRDRAPSTVSGYLPEGGKLQGGNNAEFPWTLTRSLSPSKSVSKETYISQNVIYTESNLVSPHPQDK